MKIAIVDPVSACAYGPEDLTARALGGTEVSILLLAEALRARGARVAIGPRAGEAADLCIVRDDPGTALRLADTGRVWLWRHDFAKDQAAALGRLAGRVPVVAVSDHLARALRAEVPGIEVHAIPNPVAVHDPGPVAIDRHRLVFAASPHKHRWQALNLFGALRARLPMLRLAVAHPGYKPDEDIWGEGVEAVGALSRPDLHRLIKSSLALFHATDFAESFGLLLAEANALGTPVLVPPVGAAPEVVADPRQCAPMDDADELVARIAAWAGGDRPVTGPDPRFAPAAVAAQWAALLGLS